MCLRMFDSISQRFKFSTDSWSQGQLLSGMNETKMRDDEGIGNLHSIWEHDKMVTSGWGSTCSRREAEPKSRERWLKTAVACHCWFLVSGVAEIGLTAWPYMIWHVVQKDISCRS